MVGSAAVIVPSCCRRRPAFNGSAAAEAGPPAPRCNRFRCRLCWLSSTNAELVQSALHSAHERLYHDRGALVCGTGGRLAARRVDALGRRWAALPRWPRLALLVLAQLRRGGAGGYAWLGPRQGRGRGGGGGAHDQRRRFLHRLLRRRAWRCLELRAGAGTCSAGARRRRAASAHSARLALDQLQQDEIGLIHRELGIDAFCEAPHGLTRGSAPSARDIALVAADPLQFLLQLAGQAGAIGGLEDDAC